MSISSKVGKPIDFYDVRPGDVIEVTHQYKVESVGAHFINAEGGACLSHGDWRTSHRVTLAERDRVEIPTKPGTIVKITKRFSREDRVALGAVWLLTETHMGSKRAWVSRTNVNKTPTEFQDFLERNGFDFEVVVAP